jgi:uncharacterized protein (TIGR03435 family)
VKTAALALAVAGLFAAPLAAQQPAPPYEVASVKPNRSPTAVTRLQAAPGRYTWTAATLMNLINVAFQRNAFDQREVIGGPDWVAKDRFDVVVQAPAGAALTAADGFPGGVFAMVRAVLEDRFGLVTHNEVRERPVYALTTARADRRLGKRPEARRHGLQGGDGPSGRARTRPPAAGRPAVLVWRRRGQLVGTNVSLAMLANVLSRQVGRPVVDRTGVTDYFNLTLEFSGDARTSNGPPTAQPVPVDDGRPSIFTALQEQLGLKLESTRAPVDVLVIDSASQPTEN